MNFYLVIILIIIFNMKINTCRKRLTQCYKSTKGKLNGQIYNEDLTKVTCNTTCVTYQIRNGSENFEINSCGNENELCSSNPVLIVKNNYTYKYLCCETNLCNNYSSKVLNSNCELNKTLSKNMKLIYKVRDLKAKSVKKCYYCDECKKESDFEIQDCYQTFAYTNYKKFACQVNITK